MGVRRGSTAKAERIAVIKARTQENTAAIHRILFNQTERWCDECLLPMKKCFEAQDQARRKDPEFRLHTYSPMPAEAQLKLERNPVQPVVPDSTPVESIITWKTEAEAELFQETWNNQHRHHCGDSLCGLTPRACSTLNQNMPPHLIVRRHV